MRLEAGLERLTQFLETSDPVDGRAVAEVLFKVADGTWRTDCVHWDDVTRPLQYIIEARPGLVVVVRFYREYPGSFGLVYVGPWDQD